MPKGVCLVVRETFPALRQTVYKEFIDQLQDMGFYPYVKHMKSTHEFEYQGREVYFLAADDEQKFRGIDPKLAWINEGNTIDFDLVKQIFMRLHHHCWLDYNPTDPDGWLKTEMEDVWLQNRDDVSLDVSTYLDNPFLSPAIVKEIESLEILDPDQYEVYRHGRWKKRQGLIYPKWDKNFNPPPHAKKVVALDVGYNDPSAIVEVYRHVDEDGFRHIHVKEIFYEPAKNVSDLIEAAKDYKYERLIIDSSAKGERQEFKLRGYRHIRLARKEGARPNQILKGIDSVKQHFIHIEPGSTNIIQELSRYQWRKDVTNVPEDKYNHAMDAMRYAVDYLHRKRGSVNMWTPEGVETF